MTPSIPAPGASPEGAGHTGRIGARQLEYELDLARQVQRSLFPSPLPEIRGARLAAVNQPARIVSGDLYDVIVIDPERVAILCADVSGKGFPAALMASELHAYVRATLRAACVFADTSLGPLPVQVVTLVNHELSRHYGSGRYATMFFAEYDSADRALRYVNAGQNAPLLMVDGRPVEQLADGGPPVGLFEDAVYDVGTVTVPETGTVLIYTDGVVEALNVADEEFGLARLTDVFGTMHETADGLLQAVMESLRSWSGAREQGDDITLLALSAVDSRNPPSAG
jgi:sigma-B regulation protein RsbU (phosphoserine phosphatase)